MWMLLAIPVFIEAKYLINMKAKSRQESILDTDSMKFSVVCFLLLGRTGCDFL